MGGEKPWYEEAVEDSLSEDSDVEIEVEHEAPSAESATTVEVKAEYDVVCGYKVYPGVVKRNAPGRHAIDSDGSRRRIVD